MTKAWHQVVGTIILAFLCTPALADMIDDIVAKYTFESGISGHFEQKLKLSDNEQTYVYQGRYHYSDDSGLTWELLAPNAGKVVIQSNGDAETFGEPGGLTIFNKRTVGRLIVAMVSLNKAVLSRFYQIEQVAVGNGFSIKLEAHSGWENQAGVVQISGARFVDEVRMEFPNGRIMELSLTHEN